MVYFDSFIDELQDWFNPDNDLEMVRENISLCYMSPLG